MKPVVAVIAQGTMGSGVAGRLHENGVDVITSLTGRSDASRKRAEKAGMRAVSDEEIARADIVLSITPPGQAIALAERVMRVVDGSHHPLYVDCNAINTKTVVAVAGIVEKAGCPFLDAGIIGGPPSPGRDGPTFYVSGKNAERFTSLAQYGLTVKILSDRVGEASALKMSYGALTKGLTALGAGIMLAATRSGSDVALLAELQKSQPALLSWLTKQMPGMYAKAYRWVDEMDEVAAFMQPDKAANAMFDGAARFYEQIAADFDGDKREVAALENFISRAAKSSS